MALRILFVVSLILAALALGALALQILRPPPPPVVQRPAEQQQPQVQPAAQARVFVAARRLTPGTLLRAEDLAEAAFPAGQVPQGIVVVNEDNRARLIGGLVRSPIDARAPIRPDDVIGPGQRGFLAAVLRPGMRAISVNVDLVTGTAGLIWPGDHVDLILTQESNREGLPTSRRIWSETVLTDLRVIAVDQRLAQGADAPPTGPARTLTLEVTPEGAERVAVASRLGQLSLVVRSMEAGSPEAERTRPVTVFASDVSPALLRDADQGLRMRIIQGAEDREVTFR